ncbi:MAG: LytTR family DNA-binding domain-containing protein [Chitinophagaceae bacterium]
MLSVVIIEDEQRAIEHLLYELTIINCPCRVAAILKSVEESINWFNSKDFDIDLIFMDIQLADGMSINIFKEVNIYTPVIITTAYDNYPQNSLAYNGIDYLLKPINPDKLRQSLNKFDNLKKHFTINYLQLLNNHQLEDTVARKDRIIVKKGIEYQSIKAEDVAFFYTEHKLIFVVDKEGRKYMANASNLTDLMAQLNKKIFYRANRKYIININFIKKYRPYDRVKVEVELLVQSPECVVISQENSSSFKNWIESL